MTSTAELQHNTAQPVSPTKSHADTLKIIPMTWNEMFLLTTLREAEDQEAALKFCVLELQATNILNEAYYSRICGQLAHQEAKKTE